MSKVLYREYRPRSLDDVKGQDHIVNALKNALKNDAVAHAYLFTGSHGVGKTSVARILAHLINDLEYTGENEHLDIIEIDAASNRRIDEIRELREKAFVAPTSAKYKVYIIDEVHMLTREAFNALLKTLEEPPEHAIFILATTEAHKVPSTIISRTQRFSFKPQETDSLESRLKHIADNEKIKIDPKALTLLARHSNRSFRDAISLLDQVKNIKDGGDITDDDVSQVIGVPSTELLDSLTASLDKHDSTLLFTTTEELRNQGISASVVAQELLRELRGKLKSNSNQSSTYVTVMKTLLETMNHSTFDIIEVALLQAMQGEKNEGVPAPKQNTEIQPEPIKAQPESHSKQEAKPSPEPKSKPVVEEKKPEKQAEPEAKPASNNKSTNGNVTWDDVLLALKGHHNTLYGVLKMSQATLQDDSVDITFRFAFHEKQFLQSKHTSVLKNILKEKSGKDFSITTNVNSTQQAANIPSPQPSQPQSQPQSGKKETEIANVSNIFSGAELLE